MGLAGKGWGYPGFHVRLIFSGRLANYRWIINGALLLYRARNNTWTRLKEAIDRGYANVVSSRNPEDEVYGLVYDLTSSDEVSLDRNEGVPFSYAKEILAVDFWESQDGKVTDVSLNGSEKHVLVYIDRKRVVDGQSQSEYIHRINMGIKDAVYGAGVPFSYVQKVMRHFIPEQGQTEVEELARKQAMNFEEGR